MIAPFTIDKGDFTLRPFSNSKDSLELAKIILEGLPELFLDKEVTKYSPEQETIGHNPDAYLMSVIKNYQNKTQYDFFLINNKNNTLAGLIKFIAPEKINEMYPFLSNNLEIEDIELSWGIEYYLSKYLWGSNIMRYFVNVTTMHLLKNQIPNILAFTDPLNQRSEALLKACFFKQVVSYEDQTKNYKWNLWDLRSQI